MYWNRAGKKPTKILRVFCGFPKKCEIRENESMRKLTSQKLISSDINLLKKYYIKIFNRWHHIDDLICILTSNEPLNIR